MRNGRAGAGVDDDRRSAPRSRGLLKLLHPGMGVKRWLMLGAAGIGVGSIGVAFLLSRLLALGFPDFLPSYLEGVLLLAVGVGAVLFSLYRLYRSVGPLILASDSIDRIANTIYLRRSRESGPRIVAIGGGTGLSVLLRGLKSHTDNLTAIVTVADDGGSSGRLRTELGVLPPGDFRNCLVAMSESEPLLTELFQYRFDRGNGLKGHSFGNLFIVAMTGVTDSFQQALAESGRVLAVRGRILPSTLESVHLRARMRDGRFLRGESRVAGHGGPVEAVSIEPESPAAYPPAVEAIREADIVILGPGSIYTSIVPNLLVPGIQRAVRETAATTVYVCNVATEAGETDEYSVEDHVRALQSHASEEIADYVIANGRIRSLGPQFLGEPVRSDGTPIAHAILRLADLADDGHTVRHDADRLADAVMAVYSLGGKPGTGLETPAQHTS